MKVLVTGAHGAQGSYLCEYIRAEHPEVEVLSPAREEFDTSYSGGSFPYLARQKPDRIFHLAGRPEIARSFENPSEFWSDNLMGTVNLLEGVRQIIPFARVLVASTCEVYGVRQWANMTEAHPIAPCSPYGASKAAADVAALMYARVYRMRVVVSRLFNLINPRRKDLFSSQFARQVAEIEAGKSHELVHGNLDSARTLLDVRDVVRGYWLLLEHGLPGEAYNIGSRDEMKIRDFLNCLTNMAHCTIKRRKDEALLRPVDITSQIADDSKFVAATGWAPRYTLEQSIEHLITYWRNRVSQGS